MQVDCIYNQEQAVDVTGTPAADLLSDMKKRYTAVLEQGAPLRAPSAPSYAVACNKCLSADCFAHVLKVCVHAGVWRICRARAGLVLTTSTGSIVCKR